MPAASITLTRISDGTVGLGSGVRLAKFTSTDNTPGVVADIKDPRINLKRLWVNREQNPRNSGLAEAKGELIAIQNSDDI